MVKEGKINASDLGDHSGVGLKGVQAVFVALGNRLASGDTVSIYGFGCFETVIRATRGKPLNSSPRGRGKAQKTVRFTPSGALKKKVRKVRRKRS